MTKRANGSLFSLSAQLVQNKDIVFQDIDDDGRQVMAHTGVDPAIIVHLWTFTMKKDKGTNNDLQNITHKTKNSATRTLLKSWDDLRCSGRIRSFWSTRDTRGVTLVTNQVISHE
jgi:hypothetical protein